MESKHTKGDWDVKMIYKNPFSIDTLYIINSGTAQSLKESEANAKLIAAAPELLEALELLLDGSNAPEWKRKIAINAIKKATN